MKCKECEHKLTRAEIPQHDCSIYMAAYIKKLKDENAALKEENKKLLDENNKLKNAPQAAPAGTFPNAGL